MKTLRLDVGLVVGLAIAGLLFGCPKVKDGPPVDTTPGEGNKQNESFSKSKRLLEKMYSDHRTTLYCGCRFDADKAVDLQSCGYVPAKDKRRAARIEWEHVVPAHALGLKLREWREGHPDCVRNGKSFKGRKCAEKTSRAFRLMQADMYNLYPAIGEVNGRRSNYRMAEIPGEQRAFGKCDVEIEDRKVEPRPSIRGIIARTYMYMDTAYPRHGIITKKSKRLFDAWNKKHPVTKWECERAKRIESIQGNRNMVLAGHCK